MERPSAALLCFSNLRIAAVAMTAGPILHDGFAEMWASCTCPASEIHLHEGGLPVAEQFASCPLPLASFVQKPSLHRICFRIEGQVAMKLQCRQLGWQQHRARQPPLCQSPEAEAGTGAGSHAAAGSAHNAVWSQRSGGGLGSTKVGCLSHLLPAKRQGKLRPPLSTAGIQSRPA